MSLDRHGSQSGSAGARPHQSGADGTVESPTPSLAETFLLGLVSAALETRGGQPSAPDLRRDPRWVVEEGAGDGVPDVTPAPPDSPQQTLAELLSQEGALGDYLEQQPPGEQLAALLAAIDPEQVDDYSLVELVAAHKRMESWSAAKAADAAAVLAERPALNPTWPGNLPGRTRGECLAGDELAARLRVSRLTATRLAACGRAFRGMLAATGEALEAGLIDFPRAQAIFTALDGLSPEVAIAAQWEVIDTAPGRTLRQLQQDLAKAVIAVDPHEADARHRAARQKRCVHRPRPLPDGMACISAVLPAVDAIALDLALDAAARAAKHNGDTRTLDQLRADCLALMGHTALALGHIGPHPDAHCSCGCTTTAPATGGAPTHAESTPATSPAPSQPSAAPSPAPSQPSATPSGSTVSAEPSSPAPHSADSRPPATDDRPVAASRPPDSGEPQADEPSGAPPRPPHPSPPLAAEPPHPGHRLPGCALPVVRLGTLGGRPVDVRITIPLNVALPDLSAPTPNALERDAEPVAELDGYGPIAPEVARALAAGGVWRRLITDPVTQEVLNVGRTRYQAPAGMAALVRERDKTCVEPSCSTPARRCDLDHIHEWQDGGETSVWNQEALCKRGHAVKTIGAFTVARASDGTYAWTTPTGHGYLRRTDGTTVALPRRTAEGLRAIGKELRRSGEAVAPDVVDTVLAEVAAGSDVQGLWTPPPLPDRSAPTRPDRDAGPSWTPYDEPPF